MNRATQYKKDMRTQPTATTTLNKKIQKIKTEKNFPHKINFYGCMAVYVRVFVCWVWYASRLPALKVYLAVPTSFMYKIYIIKAGYFIQKTQNVYREYNVGAELTK